MVVAISIPGLQKAHRVRINIGSVTRHLHSLARPVGAGISRLPAERRPQGSLESGRGRIIHAGQAGTAAVHVGDRRRCDAGTETLIRGSVLLPGLLISRKKEEFVFLDRTAQLAAELVLIEDLLGTARTRCRVETARSVPEKVRCVEGCVPKELEGRSMEAVGTRPRHHIHVRAWVPAVAGIIKRGLDLKFLKHVRVRNSK